MARILMRFAVAMTMVAGVAAQDPVEKLPENYKLQFENDYVKVVRVHIPAGAKLPAHAHPAALIAYIYLNDADPIVFKHDGGPGTITRQAVTARSFRLAAGMEEHHAIENNSKTASDYLRIVFKTKDAQQSRTRRRGAAPALKSSSGSVEEFKNDVMRLSRVTIAAGDKLEFHQEPNPSLLIDVTSKVGKERWVNTGDHDLIDNRNSGAVEYLRFDFLTAPQK